MLSKNAPIAVFDSGLGGISVLKELIRLLPHEDFLYFGDSKNAPYGPRSADAVCALARDCAAHLFSQGCKALVVACNTATSAAIETLRARYADRPVVGIEPALKPAVATLPHPRVLVMATEMTLKEEKFHQLMDSYGDQAEIFRLPAPGIVQCVEKGQTEGAALDAYLSGILAPYRQLRVDAVVLGCTHFPFVQAAIEKNLGYPVQMFDGAVGTARETRRRLAESGLLSDRPGVGHITLQNSLETEEMDALSQRLLLL